MKFCCIGSQFLKFSFLITLNLCVFFLWACSKNNSDQTSVLNNEQSVDESLGSHLNLDTAKPNVIIIFTDDYGYQDLGILGFDESVQTPNLDQLAREGTLFTNAYVTAPQCVPSRSALLTGINSAKVGVETNLDAPLPLEAVTIAEKIKERGYVTGFSGKWHLNDINGKLDEDLYWPWNQGFDEYLVGYLQTYTASHDLAGNSIGHGQVKDDRFRIEIQTDFALQFIERNVDKPFFLYLPYFGPHVPIDDVTEKYLSRFSSALDPTRRKGLAIIAAIDDGVGQVVKLLEDKGIRNNTLIFFLSDNGAPVKLAGGQVWNGSLNEPLYGEKGMLLDGGVRVPFIVSWKNKLLSGQTSGEMVSSLDIAATLNDYLGLEMASIDGESLMPLLKGEQIKLDREYLYFKWLGQAAIQSREYKYLYLGDGTEKVFDAQQMSEVDNFINEVDSSALRSSLDAWLTTTKRKGLPSSEDYVESNFYRIYP